MESYSFESDILPSEARADHLRVVAHEVGLLLLNHEIPFRVWSGAQAAEIGGHRQSQDVDMWVPDWAIRPAYECLSHFAQRPVSLNESFDRTIVTVGDEAEVELMANMDIYTRDGVFPLRLTSHVLYQDRQPQSSGVLPFAPPEDTILLKAILQRDESTGKHDAEDIRAMVAHMSWINEPYLLRRMHTTGSSDRALPFLQANGLALDSSHLTSSRIHK